MPTTNIKLSMINLSCAISLKVLHDKRIDREIIEIAIKLEPNVLHRSPSLSLIPIYPRKMDSLSPSVWF